MGERPLNHVPRPVLAALLTALAVQLLSGLAQPRPHGGGKHLNPPPSPEALRLASLGNPTALSRLLVLRLQSADRQPGTSLSHADQDYSLVEAWLTRILELDPQSQYPLLLAVRGYGNVDEAAKARAMMDFAYRQFLLDPERRWRWAAESAIWLKHRLHDPEGALTFARALREKATGAGVPPWARQMEIFILEDLDEIESAKVLLGGLISSGQIDDPNELHFLAGVAQRLAQRQTGIFRIRSSTPPPNPPQRKLVAARMKAANNANVIYRQGDKP